MKLLFSARDPAAGHAIKNLVNIAHADNRFVVQVIAAPPALELLRETPCVLYPLSSTNPAVIETAIIQTLKTFKPDAVISGASGPDAGVDEYLVKLSKLFNVRSYVVQDFWGDVNLSLNVPPDCYLVSDSFAAKITRQRVDTEVHVVGSVKHAGYADIDVEDLRAKGRLTFGVTEDEPVIGYFGMPLGNYEGYWRTLEELLKSITGMSATLIYRPHPKEGKEVRLRTFQLLESFGKFMEDQSGSVEETMAASDLIVSCYSSCGVDSELLGQNFKQDSRLSVFLLFDEEILELYQDYTKLDDLPISYQKRSFTVKDQSKLRDVFETFLESEARLDYLISGDTLPSVGNSVVDVLDKIYDDYSRM